MIVGVSRVLGVEGDERDPVRRRAQGLQLGDGAATAIRPPPIDMRSFFTLPASFASSVMRGPKSIPGSPEARRRNASPFSAHSSPQAIHPAARDVLSCRRSPSEGSCRRAGAQASAVSHRHATERPDPKASLAIRVQRPDVFIGKAVALTRRDEVAPCKVREPAASTIWYQPTGNRLRSGRSP